MKKTHVRTLGAILFVLLAAALACNFSAKDDTDERSATVEALGTSVAATSTALAGGGETAATPTAADQAAPPTPDLAATQQSGELVATEQARSLEATQQASGLAATEAALEPIKNELQRYGVDPQNGQLAWVQGPLKLETDQYMGSNFGNMYPQVIVQDFVLSADIRWETRYGAAGCAFVFRSDGNQSKPNQYMVWMTRLTNGRVEFLVFAEGEIVALKDFYANGIDPHFDGGSGAINRLTVVGQGNKFTVYTNGVKLGVGDPNAPIPPLTLPDPPKGNPNDAAYQRALTEYRAVVARLKEEYNRRVALAKRANKDYPAGIVAMGAMAESGYTMCEFNNAWLWLIGP